MDETGTVPAARSAARQEIAYARAAGMSCLQVGEALGITGGGEGVEHSIAERAFEYAAPHDGDWAQTYGPIIRWDRGSCGGRVTDRGPDARLAEGEEGHQEGCARRAADLTAWEAAWDDD